jgi:protein-tyrosine-phosphatase
VLGNMNVRVQKEEVTEKINGTPYIGAESFTSSILENLAQREHWGFDDPAKAEGTEEEKWTFFQRIRDEIGEKIKQFDETGK